MTTEEKILSTVNWLKDKMKETKTKGLLVGVSGGIDSAVVANLIKLASPDNCLGVILPIHNSSEDLVDANALCESCDIKKLTIDLSHENESILDKVESEMKELFIKENKKIVDANMRARLRMTALYSIANNLNYLVVGTDNAAELLTGYFTKYGDGGVDILPLANLLKNEVYEWGRYFNVPENILAKAPTAGLWEGQTDEKEMGTTYKYIDMYLQGKEIPQEDKVVIERLNARSEHKRTSPPHPPLF
ncbi:NAD(+) synthase [Proteocatella sphenisci]|uniref:NAD(+) synthase n=1 Tax=Proteocatella sphenisci TaxID=181070 RepID=UPI00048BFE15|nr:NAD(+) synthase [Proteocatella sphenisci]